MGLKNLFLKFFSKHFFGRRNFVGNGMFRQLVQQADFAVENGTHTVGDVLLMGPVNGYAFFAVSVIAACLLAGTVIFIPLCFPESGGKFFLQL